MNVILLRTPSFDLPDPYEQAFQQAGYHPSSVPVLETNLMNLDDLESILRDSPSAAGYTGVVVTSARACEAWKSVAKRLIDSRIPLDTSSKWSSLPFYVVGKATARALGSIRDTYGDTQFTPNDICGAYESGTSERLAHFILDDLGKRSALNPKLLYLTGDKNRDTLPNILGNGGVQVNFLQVYETQPCSNLEASLQAVVHTASPAMFWWIVFFAPSAAATALPSLRKWFHIVSEFASKPEPNQPVRRPRLASIGPTTATSMWDELQVRVDVVSAKPTPSDVVDAIVAYDKVQGPVLPK